MFAVTSQVVVSRVSPHVILIQSDYVSRLPHQMVLLFLTHHCKSMKVSGSSIRSLTS